MRDVSRSHVDARLFRLLLLHRVCLRSTREIVENVGSFPGYYYCLPTYRELARNKRSETACGDLPRAFGFYFLIEQQFLVRALLC